MKTPGSVKQQIFFFRKRLLTTNSLPMKQWISLNPSKLMPTNNDENTVTENMKIFLKLKPPSPPPIHKRIQGQIMQTFDLHSQMTKKKKRSK